MTIYDESLKQLIEILSRHKGVIEFKEAEKLINANPVYRELAYDMKKSQQNAVQFEKMQKEVAEKASSQRASALEQIIDEQPVVENYREKMQDASDLLQYITKSIEDRVNKEFIDDQS